jgi:hypothetical protein
MQKACKVLEQAGFAASPGVRPAAMNDDKIIESTPIHVEPEFEDDRDREPEPSLPVR